MTPQFVQLTCTKDNGDFMLVSNTGLMATRFCTPFEALNELSLLASEYHKQGYKTLWTHEDAGEWDMELFDPSWATEENKIRMGFYRYEEDID